MILIALCFHAANFGYSSKDWWFTRATEVHLQLVCRICGQEPSIYSRNSNQVSYSMFFYVFFPFNFNLVTNGAYVWVAAWSLASLNTCVKVNMFWFRNHIRWSLHFVIMSNQKENLEDMFFATENFILFYLEFIDANGLYQVWYFSWKLGFSFFLNDVLANISAMQKNCLDRQGNVESTMQKGRGRKPLV